MQGKEEYTMNMDLKQLYGAVKQRIDSVRCYRCKKGTEPDTQTNCSRYLWWRYFEFAVDSF